MRAARLQSAALTVATATAASTKKDFILMEKEAGMGGSAWCGGGSKLQSEFEINGHPVGQEQEAPPRQWQSSLVRSSKEAN